MPISTKTGHTVHYQLKVDTPRAATPQDEDRLAAQTSYEQAYLQEIKLSPDASDFEAKAAQIANDYEHSAEKWQSAGEHALGIISLIQAGHLFYDADQERALGYYEKARQQSMAAKDLRGQAEALSNLGHLQDQLSKNWEEKLEARKVMVEALALSIQAGDLRVETSSLSNLGMHYRSSGDFQAALEHQLRALEKARLLGDQELEELILGNTGAAYRSLGLKSEAEQAYTMALSILSALSKKEESEPKEPIFDEQEIADEEARFENGLGKVIELLGDQTMSSKKEACKKYNDAVEKGQNSALLDTYVHNLGAIYLELGDFQLRRKAHGEARKNYASALVHLEKARKLRGESVSKRAHHTLTSLGLLSHSLGKPREASEYLQKAFDLCVKANDEYQKAIVLAAQARVARDRNQLALAKTKIEEALKIVEELGLRISVLEWRANYANSQQYFYDLYADILLRMQTQQRSSANTRIAWQQIERGRMANLREYLEVSQVSLLQGVDSKLIEERKDLRNRIAVSRSAKASKESVDVLIARYKEIEEQIQMQNPKYARLLALPLGPVSINELQQSVLTKDSILLEYALGPDRSYVWAITPTAIEVFPLPSQSEIESLALELLNFMIDERTNDPSPAGADPIRLQRLKSVEAGYKRAAAKLSDAILGPVAQYLKNRKFLIVSDGILSRIPLGALPLPASFQSSAGGEFRLAIEDHEFSYAPSAAMLLFLKRRENGAMNLAPSVVTIADPIFNSKDPRANYCHDKRKTPNQISPVLTASVDSLAEDFSPVPFNNPEKEKFRSAVFGQLAPASRKEYFDFQAKRDNVIGDRLARYTDIIFYTHGILNERDQGMSGLALSRLNERCEQQDYFLSLNDVYNLKLSADLVTLVACETARNRMNRGFGLGNLSRGFMFAGASKVLGTLWKVDGKASLELMTRFYQNRRAGQSPATALQTAQVSFLRDSSSDWRLPYYWAGFVLTGEIN